MERKVNIVYDTLQDMIDDHDLRAGMVAKILGRDSVSDGYGNLYIICDPSSGIPHNPDTDIALSKTDTWASLVIENRNVADIADLKERTSTLEGTSETLVYDMGVVKEALSDMCDVSSDLDTRVEALEEDNTTNKEAISGLTTSLDDVGTDVARNTSNISYLQGNVASLSEYVYNMPITGSQTNGTINEMTDYGIIITGYMNATKSIYVSADSNATDIKTRLNNAESTLTEVNSKIDTINTSIDTIIDNIDTLNTDVQGILSGITTMKADIEDLKSKVEPTENNNSNASDNNSEPITSTSILRADGDDTEGDGDNTGDGDEPTPDPDPTPDPEPDPEPYLGYEVIENADSTVTIKANKEYFSWLDVSILNNIGLDNSVYISDSVSMKNTQEREEYTPEPTEEDPDPEPIVTITNYIEITVAHETDAKVYYFV